MARVQARLSTSKDTWIKDATKTPLGRGMAVTTLLGVTTGVTTGVITLLAVATWAVITSAVAGSAVFCWQRVGPSGNAVPQRKFGETSNWGEEARDRRPRK
eukprot:scaffold67157_cov57-Phaeocystis_antarctica.AAC.2